MQPRHSTGGKRAMKYSQLDIIILWFLAYFSALAACGARLGFMLFGISIDPPEDAAAYRSWVRRRRWLVVSELSALPAFATFSVEMALLQQWNPATVALVSMVLGALGFAFLLDALQTIVRRKIGGS